MSPTYPFACTLGICDGFNLLLPNNAIADVVSSMSITTTPKDQKWVVGELNWRELNIPVVSFEQLILQRTPRLRGSHVAIFHGTLDTEKMPFYGVTVQAIPHNFSLLKESDLTERMDDLKLDYCSMKVTARGVASIIPDLNNIEAKILSS